MSSGRLKQRYKSWEDPDGGRFQDWVDWYYRRYRLPVPTKSESDPCKDAESVTPKRDIEFYTHQQFVAQYMSSNTRFLSLLLYHNVGTGKTPTAINCMITLFSAHPKWNFYIMIPAQLRHVWEEHLKVFVPEKDYDALRKCCKFVNHNASNAYNQLMDAFRQTKDRDNSSFFIIDEVHRFVRTVYSNITQDSSGKNAFSVYNAIATFRQQHPTTKLLALSATPAFNHSFELALLFNLLRRGSFPDTEDEFESTYVQDGVLRPDRVSLFSRYIVGLVSYYEGAVEGRRASVERISVPCELVGFCLKTYLKMEAEEEQLFRRKHGQFGDRKRGVLEVSMTGSKGSQKNDSHSTYTRQAGTFVIPDISEAVNGLRRPRPSEFKASEVLMRGIDPKEKTRRQKAYTGAIQAQYRETGKYWEALRDQDGDAWVADLAEVKRCGDVEQFLRGGKMKSAAMNSMFVSSPKMVRILLRLHTDPGPAMMFSMFVMGEGIDAFKVMLGVWGYGDLKSVRTLKYAQYHGGIPPGERQTQLDRFNDPKNFRGELVRLILLSPTATEGISLRNVRQVHILQPGWNQETITQASGRAIRDCSHRDLPREERNVRIYLYYAVRETNGRLTTDQKMLGQMERKTRLLGGFRKAMRGASVDCNLFWNENQGQKTNPETCFQLDHDSRTYSSMPVFTNNLKQDMLLTAFEDTIKTPLYLTKAVIASGQCPVSEAGYRAPVVTRSGVLDVGYCPETGMCYDWDSSHEWGAGVPLGTVCEIGGIPETHNGVLVIRHPLVNMMSVNDELLGAAKQSKGGDQGKQRRKHEAGGEIRGGG